MPTQSTRRTFIKLSVARAFVSEIADKPWFYARAFWTAYLATLAAARLHRFNFALGFGWDFPRGVTGDYLHFPYPYLVEVPGYEQAHIQPALQPSEHQRNLEALQFIAAETARRGMDFQLGIWTHAYQWTDSPRSDHHIAGLTPQIHAAYCRDALAALLPAAYTASPYPLQYYFERRTATSATLHPTFNPTLSNQTCYAVHIRT